MAFRFKRFQVYQDAKQLHKDIVILTKNWSKEYYYLSDQARRSSLSIILNIAEGSSKQSDKDFNRFITIALGSIDETVACLEVALSFSLLSDVKYNLLLNKCEIISRQLGGLSKSLKRPNH